MPVLQERPKIEQSRSVLPIFVLDDEADHVEMTTSKLERAGFPAYGTTNPVEALEKVRGGGRRVVIADFKMPEMDGMTFLEKALQSDPGMYVILVTGSYTVDSAIETTRIRYVRSPIRLMKSRRGNGECPNCYRNREVLRY